jgi:general stress protein YciG
MDQPQPTKVNRRKSNRGFAAMSPERRREIASAGGKASRGGGRRPRQAQDDAA